MPIKRCIFTAIVLTAFMASAGRDLPEYSLRPETESPATDYGSIDRYIVKSRNLDADITVDVWVPQTYGSDTGEQYPVLYAHDGQNVFDPRQSFTNVAWELDRSSITFTIPILGRRTRSRSDQAWVALPRSI